MNRDAFTDVAAILHPLPEPADEVDEVDEVYDAARQEAEQRRRLTAEHLRLAWNERDHDPLLSALASARQIRENAETQIGHLLAYGREFAGRRPYTLNELAQAAGMSVSGVRTGYDHHDVDEVADMINGRPRNWDASDPEESDEHEVEILLNDLQRRGTNPARGRVPELYQLLTENGWKPHPPAAQAPGTQASKRYVRWVRRWPRGTTIILYQEASTLGASSKLTDSDSRRFWVDYAVHDTVEVGKKLADLTRRIDEMDQARARQHPDQ